MGEAKRRKKLDPNYGKNPNYITPESIAPISSSNFFAELKSRETGGFRYTGFNPDKLTDESEQFLHNLSRFTKNYVDNFQIFIDAAFHENTFKSWRNILREITTNNNQILSLSLDKKIFNVELKQTNSDEVNQFIEYHGEFIGKQWANGLEWREKGERVNFVHFLDSNKGLCFSTLISLEETEAMSIA